MPISFSFAARVGRILRLGIVFREQPHGARATGSAGAGVARSAAALPVSARRKAGDDRRGDGRRASTWTRPASFASIIRESRRRRNWPSRNWARPGPSPSRMLQCHDRARRQAGSLRTAAWWASTASRDRGRSWSAAQPEMTEIEPNNTLPQACAVPLGTTVNGVVKDTTTDYFKFSARRGQRIIIDCWAFRNRLEPRRHAGAVRLRGRELLRDQNTNRRDPLLDFTPAEDGQYIVAPARFSVWVLRQCGRVLLSSLDFYGPVSGLHLPTGGLTRLEWPIHALRPKLARRPGGHRQPGRRLAAGETYRHHWAAGGKGTAFAGDRLVTPSEASIDGIEYRLDSPQGLSNPCWSALRTHRSCRSRSPTTIRPRHRS